MCIPHIAFYLETFEMINKCRHSTPILYTGDINNQEEVNRLLFLFLKNKFNIFLLGRLLFHVLINWQVFEFLFQNKYTADEDVDLEEVKASSKNLLKLDLSPPFLPQMGPRLLTGFFSQEDNFIQLSGRRGETGGVDQPHRLCGRALLQGERPGEQERRRRRRLH